jgi:hypothetical protein
MKLISRVNVITGKDGPLLAIHSTALSSDGRIFASDEFNNKVAVLGSDGRAIRMIGGRGAGFGQFWYPRGLALVPSGNAEELYVCDSWNHRIQRFTLDGEYLGAFGSIGSAEGNFNEPVSIAYWNGAVYVLDRCNHRITKHEPGGHFLASIGKGLSIMDELTQNDPAETLLGSSAPVRGFQYPSDFSILGDGSFVVADTGNRRICRATVDGVVSAGFKLDVLGNPPYRYPLKITALGGMRILLGTFEGYEVVDALRPWVHAGNIFGDLNPSYAGSIYTEGELIIVDGRKGEIVRLENEDADLDINKEPSAFPDDESLKSIPNRWTEIDEGAWKSSIRHLPEGAERADKAIEFINACLKSAESSAKELMEAEAEMCKHISTLTEMAEETRTGKRNAAQWHEGTWARLQYNKLFRRRAVLRAALIGSIAAIVETLEGGYEGYLADNRLKFINTLMSERNDRVKDYDEIAEWIRDRFAKPETMILHAGTQAVLAVYLFSSHIDYLDRAIHRLDRAYKESYPAEYRAFKQSSLRYANTDYITMAWMAPMLFGELCSQWNYHDSVIALYTHGASYIDGGEREYLLMLAEALDCAGRRGVEYSAVIAKISSAPPSNEIVKTVESLHRLGEYELAKSILDKVKSEVIPADAAKLLLMANETLRSAGPLCKTLRKGESLELASGGCALRYLGSLAIIHPFTGALVQPHIATMLPDRSLAVTNFSGEIIIREEDGKCRVAAKTAGHITGMAPAGRNNVVCAVRTSGDSAGTGLVMINLETGEIENSGRFAKCPLPPSPFRIAAMEDGNFAIAEACMSDLWIVTPDFEESRNISVENLGAIADISINGAEFFATSVDNGGLYRGKIDGGAGVYIGANAIFNPSGVASRGGIVVVISSGGGLGLQAYNLSGGLLGGALAVNDGGKIYSFGTSLVFWSRAKHAGADMFVPDYINNRIHLFSAGSDMAC